MYNTEETELFMGCIAVFIVVVFLSGLSLIRLNTDSNGEHNGYITAVEQNGLFYQNYAVYVKTDNQSSQEDRYCVPENETDLANQLREYNKTRTQVLIHYKGIRGLGWDLCNADQITSVEKATNSVQ